jgi:hypothetical protein
MAAPLPTQTPSPSSSRAEGKSSQFNWEKDSLYILPLSIIPLRTPSLRRARILKDARLNSVVELFHDLDTGSGRLNPDKLNQVFDWPEDRVHPDFATIKALGEMQSFDVFSLRIELRRLNISVNDHTSLRLSEDKNRELTKYMTVFTRPLIQQIYGGSEAKIADINDLIAMFSSPNKEEALKNLALMAAKLGIQKEEVPEFLEDYGDIFLSLAYFKDELDKIIPSIMDLINSLMEIKSNFQLGQDQNFLSTCDNIGKDFSDITSSITGRFESFDRHSQGLWVNITAESFRKVRKLIAAHHATIGGVLCGLKVKMDAWDERFGKGQGGPLQRADFIMSDLKQGIDVITRIEEKAPKISDI